LKALVKGAHFAMALVLTANLTVLIVKALVAIPINWKFACLIFLILP
jgi:hypothetical protein